MAGSSIVRTRPRNHAWDHCGETSAYKTTQRPLLYLCLNEWDVLMWSIRLCNSLGEASPYKVTWLHRLRLVDWMIVFISIHAYYIYIYIYHMDCLCQRYHKECSTRTCADDCCHCWKKFKLKSFVRPWFHGCNTNRQAACKSQQIS